MNWYAYNAPNIILNYKCFKTLINRELYKNKLP